jgi:hypothetical protein
MPLRIEDHVPFLILSASEFAGEWKQPCTGFCTFRCLASLTGPAGR